MSWKEDDKMSFKRLHKIRVIRMHRGYCTGIYNYKRFVCGKCNNNLQRLCKHISDITRKQKENYQLIINAVKP